MSIDSNSFLFFRKIMFDAKSFPSKHIVCLIKLAGLVPFAYKNNKFTKSYMELSYSFFVLILMINLSILALIIKENQYDFSVNISDYFSVTYSVFIKCLTLVNAILYRENVSKQ